jgi:hypothetical protein
MTAYRRDIAFKSMYYIEIHGIRAPPGAAPDGVFARLTDSCGSLKKFYAWLARFFAPPTNFFARLAGLYERVV